jgi:putative ABC transport system permease protein
MVAGFRRIFRLPRRASDVTQDVDAELHFHFEQRVADLVARGWTRDAARAEAERAFGDVERVRGELARIDAAQLRDKRRWEWGDGLAQDVRYAFRGLRRQPSFAAVVVLTLAVGIAANTAMFRVLDRLLLRAPEHIVDADRVTRLYLTRYNSAMKGPQTATSFPDYLNWRAKVTAFSQIAAYAGSRPMVLRESDRARTLGITWTTASFFPLLGVRPAIGRFYAEEEDRAPVGSRVIVLSYDYWQSQLGGDASVLGKALRLDGLQFIVIGVTPRGFTGAELGATDGFIPVSSIASSAIADNWNTFRGVEWISVIARLRDGVSRAQASAQATTAYRANIPTDWGDEKVIKAAAASSRVEMAPIIEARGPNRPALATVAIWLGGVAAVVLLVVCANVGNLLLARNVRRRRELALRAALGAGRGRVASQLLVETGVLALCGGVLGALLAALAWRVLGALFLGGSAAAGSALDVRAAMSTIALMLVVTLVSGVAPAWLAGRHDLTEALKSGTKGGGARRSRLQAGLLVAQTALSMLLLVGASLFVRSIWRATHVDQGFDAAHLLYAQRFDPASATESDAMTFSNAARERLSSLPGVQSVLRVSVVPNQARMWATLTPDGASAPIGTTNDGPYWVRIDTGYFAAAHTALRRGRSFTIDDRDGAPPVAIITERLARHLWPTGDALGQCVHFGKSTSPCRTVIGIAADQRMLGIDDETSEQIFFPVTQLRPQSPTGLLVRTNGDAAAMAPTVERALQPLVPPESQLNVLPLKARIDQDLRPRRVGAGLLTAFGGVALLIAAVGLFSVASFTVAQRTREIGVRVALGARTSDVLSLVMTDGVRVALAGVVLGAILSLPLGRALAPLLFHTSPHDPVAIVAVALVLLTAALLASLVPARRATRVDPAVALRSD